MELESPLGGIDYINTYRYGLSINVNVELGIEVL